MTMGSLLFKKDKFSIPEAHVDKKLKKFFLHDVSNWKLKWRKINQINLVKLIIQNDRRKKGFKKVFW